MSYQQGSNVLRKGRVYDVADRGHLIRLTKDTQQWHSRKYQARWTGEYREPKKGEWFLSGSIIVAYYATNDLSSKYHIAEIVQVEKVEILKVVRVF